jgi:TRAP-type C4-dicarboxylate transport system permease small subunit
MSHGYELESSAARPVTPDNPAVAGFSLLLDRVNTLLLRLSMVAMVLTALILTYSVVTRYFLKIPTDWQDETSVFMLVGVTFFSSAYVQSYRGHIGIEALATILPASVNAARLFIVDAASFLFCAFFSWKSWTLFHEALKEGQTTVSTLASPLWIPYVMMALGMTLLSIQLFIQVLIRASNKKGAQQ